MEIPLSQPDNLAYVSLDLCGLRCPHHLINVIAAIRSLEPGQHLQVRATDLTAPSSITSWSNQSGNELLDMYQEGDYFVFVLKRNPNEVARFEEERAALAKKEEGRKLTANS